VELTRLRWRRAVIVLLVTCVLVPTLIWVGLAWNTRPVSDSDLRNAQQQVERQSQEPSMKREINRCVTHPGRYGADLDDPESSCQEMMGPRLDWFLYRPQLQVADEREGSGLAVITILVALVMLLGTTFVGHDWASGSMSNQLLFEPRRLRIWIAKGVVVFLAGLVVSALVLAAYWGAIWLLAESRDLQATEHQWDLIRHSAMRGSLLVAFAGLGGYALTMLFRSTVATIGVMFASAVGGSLVIIAVLGEEGQRWLVTSNFSAVLFNGYEYSTGDSFCESTSAGTECTGVQHVTLEAGALYLGVLALLAAALSVWSFRQRDVP
jgi:hypothetical protein